MAEKKQKLNLAEYARHRGVTANAVRKAIQREHISSAASKTDDGRWSIDTEHADRLWSANIDPSISVAMGAGGRAKAQVKKKKARGLPQTASGFAENLAEAKARKESAMANLAELKMAEREGELVPAREVGRSAFSSARQLRTKLVASMVRVSKTLTSETDSKAIEQKLLEEVARVLDEFTQNINR